MKSKILTKIFRFLGKGTHCPHSKQMAEGTKKISDTEEFEHCVMCGELTAIPISMPVDWRENYEIGLGQLCPDCAKKARKGSDTLPDVRVQLAIVQSIKENDK